MRSPVQTMQRQTNNYNYNYCFISSAFVSTRHERPVKGTSGYKWILHSTIMIVVKLSPNIKKHEYDAVNEIQRVCGGFI